MTMKPPMKGARKGPVKTITLNRQIAIPRVLFANMSAKTAATIYVHISTLSHPLRFRTDTYGNRTRAKETREEPTD